MNLTRASATHAGSATWETIRMDPWRASDDAVLLRTLAHETAHVIALRASDRRIEGHAGAFRFFNEGLAERLALEHAPDVAYRGARELEAALSRRRLQLEFTDMLDFERFNARFGEAAVYAPALLWVDALAKACGDDAPKRVLGGLAAPTVPRDADGVAIWRHVLQGMQCDLSRVSALWGEKLERLASEFQAEIAQIPSVAGGAPALQDGELLLNATLEGEPLPGAAYFVAIRSRTGAALVGSEYEVNSFSAEVLPDRSLEFFIEDAYDPGDSIEFQFAITWLRDGAIVQHLTEWKKALRPTR